MSPQACHLVIEDKVCLGLGLKQFKSASEPYSCLWVKLSKWQLIVQHYQCAKSAPTFLSTVCAVKSNSSVKMKEIEHMPAIFIRCILGKEWGITGITTERGFNLCGVVIYKYFHFYLLLGSRKELEQELKGSIPKRTCFLQALIFSENGSNTLHAKFLPDNELRWMKNLIHPACTSSFLHLLF